MLGFKPAVVLDRRSDLSCPQDNGTVWSADGYSWAILCDYDFPGNDLPAQPATSLTECIDACNDYKQNEQYLSGASCVAVVYAASNINGNPCYLKAKIDTVSSGTYMQYVARRVQYSIGEAPIYTSIEPSASATSPPVQASTSAPSVSSSAAIVDSSTAIAKTQPPPSTQSTVSTSVGSSSVPLASASSTTGKSLSSSDSPATTLAPPQTSVSTLTQSGVTKTTTALASASTLTTTENTNTNMVTASTASTSSTPTSSTPSTTPSSTSSTSLSGLSDGAKIGIGVGLGVAVAIIISLLLYIFCTRHQRKNTRDPSTTQSTELPSTNSRSTLLSRILPSHPSAGNRGNSHLASEVPEMSSPQPAAAELEWGKYHELAGGTHSRALELDGKAHPIQVSTVHSGTG